MKTNLVKSAPCRCIQCNHQIPNPQIILSIPNLFVPPKPFPTRPKTISNKHLPNNAMILNEIYFFSSAFAALAENICCHTSIHSRCRCESIFCGLRTISVMISRTRMLNLLNASICFQFWTENRKRLLSIEMTPEYI